MMEPVHIPGLGDIQPEYAAAAAGAVGVAIWLQRQPFWSAQSPHMRGLEVGLMLAPSVSGLFSAPNPSKFTIATFENEADHSRKWIHAGNREAVAQSFIIALGAALYTGSWVPFIMIMGMAAWKVWSYEDALTGGNGMGAPKFDMRNGARESVRTG